MMRLDEEINHINDISKTKEKDIIAEYYNITEEENEDVREWIKGKKLTRMLFEKRIPGKSEYSEPAVKKRQKAIIEMVALVDQDPRYEEYIKTQNSKKSPILSRYAPLVHQYKGTEVYYCPSTQARDKRIAIAWAYYLLTTAQNTGTTEKIIDLLNEFMCSNSANSENFSKWIDKIKEQKLLEGRDSEDNGFISDLHFVAFPQELMFSLTTLLVLRDCDSVPIPSDNNFEKIWDQFLFTPQQVRRERTLSDELQSFEKDKTIRAKKGWELTPHQVYLKIISLLPAAMREKAIKEYQTVAQNALYETYRYSNEQTKKAYELIMPIWREARASALTVKQSAIPFAKQGIFSVDTKKPISKNIVTDIDFATKRAFQASAANKNSPLQKEDRVSPLLFLHGSPLPFLNDSESFAFAPKEIADFIKTDWGITDPFLCLAGLLFASEENNPYAWHLFIAAWILAKAATLLPYSSLINGLNMIFPGIDEPEKKDNPSPYDFSLCIDAKATLCYNEDNQVASVYQMAEKLSIDGTEDWEHQEKIISFDDEEQTERTQESDYQIRINFAQVVYKLTGLIVSDFLKEDTCAYGLDRLFDQSEMKSKILTLQKICQKEIMRTRIGSKAGRGEENAAPILENTTHPVEEEPGGNELDELAEQNKNLRRKNDEYQKQIRELSDILRTKESEKDDKKIIEDLTNEINDLRSLVYTLANKGEKQEKECVSTDIEFPYTLKKRVVIFGGHDTWLNAIKTYIQGASYYGDKPHTPLQVFKSADEIWIQSNCIGHGNYWYALGTAKKAGKPVRFFNCASAKQAAMQIIESDQKRQP